MVTKCDLELWTLRFWDLIFKILELVYIRHVSQSYLMISLKDLFIQIIESIIDRLIDLYFYLMDNFDHF